ncbi:unnamed protein product [Cylindrotheca closterium]|uniref:Uncharacterized protein n=1 Tax=Cylindrotheca closterium TaxID=2856 RepID=A0AAD2GD42_9STRA|nr:unnamed protein product [Cylindrotheca closterium]
MNKSQSIPISPSSYLRHEDMIRQQRSHWEYKAMMVNADLTDYLVYNRIIIGIAKTIEATKNAKLRDQNQALVDHIHYIRHTQVSSRAVRKREADDLISRKQDDDEALIFEMEI